MPWKRMWHPTQVPLPGKSMDSGAWWAAVHGVAKSRTQLSDFTFTFHPWGCGSLISQEKCSVVTSSETAPSDEQRHAGGPVRRDVGARMSHGDYGVLRSLARGTPDVHPPVPAVSIPACVYRAEGRGEMALVVPGREQTVFLLTACSLLGMKTIHS